LIFLHPSDELYGADRMLLEILGAVPAEIEVEVWVPNDLAHPAAALCEELIRRDVTVRHLDLPIMRRAYLNPRGIVALTRRASHLIRELKAAQPDAVYCTTSAAHLGAPLARLAGVPRVIGHVQEIWSRTDQMILSLPARSCHTLLSISEAVSNSLPANLRRRTVVVPNGTPEPARVVRLDGRVGELQFIIASRWNGWKGHGTLLRAWEKAGSPGRLTILGGPPLSGESVDVVGLVATLSEPESVSIIGEVTDPSSYFEAADVVVVPSDRPEPFGLVAIEAFARARPVIGSAAGGLMGIVSDGEDGWLFPNEDSDSLAQIFVGLSREAVTAAGNRARETYRSRFTIDRFVRRWRDVVLAEWEHAGADKG
jgi:glycosyltransferase involved in cell wall biosynthesis